MSPRGRKCGARNCTGLAGGRCAPVQGNAPRTLVADRDGVELDFEQALELCASDDDAGKTVAQEAPEGLHRCSRAIDVAEIYFETHQVGERRARLAKGALERSTGAL